MPRSRSLLCRASSAAALVAVVAAVAVAAVLMAPGTSAQLSAPDEAAVKVLRDLLPKAKEYAAHLDDLALQALKVTDARAYSLDAVLTKVAGSPARAAEDGVVGKVVPGLTAEAAERLALGDKNMLALALTAAKRNPLPAKETNELVYALILKQEHNGALSAEERAFLREVVAWKKEGMAVVNGRFVSATAAKAGLAEDVSKKLEGHLPTGFPPNPNTAWTWNDIMRNEVFDTARVTGLRAPVNPAAYDAFYDELSAMVGKANSVTDDQVDRISRLIKIANDQKRRGVALSPAQARLISSGPRLMELADKGAAESRAFVAKIFAKVPQVDELQAGIGRMAAPSIDGVALKGTAADIKASIDKKIESLSSNAQNSLLPPKQPPRGVGAPQTATRLWADSKVTESAGGLELFKRYSKGKLTPSTPKGDLALHMNGESTLYDAYNYELLNAALIRADKAVPIDELASVALLLRQKAEKAGAILNPAEREFLTAFGELSDSIGKTRFVWRDGVVLSKAESADLYDMLLKMRSRKYTTFDALDHALNTRQSAMYKELIQRTEGRSVPAGTDLEHVLRQPSSGGTNVIDYFHYEFNYLRESDRAAKQADSHTLLTRMKNLVTTGHQYLP